MSKIYLCLKVAIAALTILPLGLASNAQAASLWNEAVDGDLSDNGASPTQLGALMPGSNLIRATFNAGSTNPSPDYFTVEIPEDLVLTDIILGDWKAAPTFEDIAFLAVQEGNVFDFVVPADRSNADGLLGWTHLRSTQVGSNKVLTELALSNQSPDKSGVAAFYAAEAQTYPPDLLAQFPELPGNLKALEDQWVPGAKGFDIPLTAGEYTFWLRQGSDTSITAELEFLTTTVEEVASTPEPVSLLAIGLVSGAGLLLQRKRDLQQSE